MIRFSCPGCGATYSVDDSKGGKSGKCPKCQSQFVIPTAAEAGVPAPPAPPPVPPAPAPAADPNAPVEIAPCPKCQARLSVATSDLGSDVECPYCQTVYKAVKPGTAASAPLPPRGEEDRPSRRPARAEDDEGDRPSRRRRRDEDDEEDDRPSRRGRRAEADDEEEDRPSRRGRRDDDEEEDRPSRRRRDDDDRPRKKKKRRAGGGEPHRGTMILVLGILSWVLCGIFTAIPAWIMGRGDLRKMDDGTMDDEGRSTTQIGMYLGMASTILNLVFILGYCVLVVIAVAAGGGK